MNFGLEPPAGPGEARVLWCWCCAQNHCVLGRGALIDAAMADGWRRISMARLTPTLVCPICVGSIMWLCMRPDGTLGVGSVEGK